MSESQGGEYSFEQIQDELRAIRRSSELAEQVIRETEDERTIEHLVNNERIDTVHDGERGIGDVRRAILESNLISDDLKQTVSTRGDRTTEYDILVPDRAGRNALGAIKAGKPIVLYGPTGTGKTTFAKQLALETSIGYSLYTASPSWTKQDIIGGVSPKYSDDTIEYRKELGCVTEAVQRARDFGGEYTVIIDEITRSDISKIFGPLYTAIENPHQTIFKKEDGTPLALDPDVNIICTMNMSDRTVNELDNAITRRFAMVEINEYGEDKRTELFEDWYDEYLVNSPFERDGITNLFNQDYEKLNGKGEELTPIIHFGPMHYEDVASFLGETCTNDGVYSEDPAQGVGEAFRTYIVPRLLNSASFTQIERITEHYEWINDQFDQHDLTPARDLAERELESEKQSMGAYE